MSLQLSKLSIGAAWRPELAEFIDQTAELGFTEIMWEDFNHAEELPGSVERLLNNKIPIIPHSVSLSLGGAELPDGKRLDDLARLSERVQAPFVSEHVAFTEVGGIDAGHLLPLPHTEAALSILVENIVFAKKRLPIPIAIENIADIFAWSNPEMDEGTFLRRALTEADALLLLDVSNLYASSHNLSFDPVAFIDCLPLERLAYVHIAGGEMRDGLYHDTHAHEIPSNALMLLEELCSRVDPPGVLLERDDRFPDLNDFLSEINMVEAAMTRGIARRRGPDV